LRKLAEKILLKALRLIGKIKKANKHPNLSVDVSSVLLDGSVIRFSTKRDDRVYVQIGNKCLIKSDFLFETEKGSVSIGNNVHIGGALFICRNKIVIKDDVLMAWGITFYDHNSHSIEWKHRKYDSPKCYDDYFNHNGNNIANKDWTHVIDKPIVVESKVWIGFNVTILKGVTIGEGAVVGACSVVAKDVEPWTVVAGNPARVIKRIHESSYNRM
jgi:acetyltransferase-like isoleucine patch superfamily enzyme